MWGAATLTIRIFGRGSSSFADPVCLRVKFLDLLLVCIDLVRSLARSSAPAFPLKEGPKVTAIGYPVS